MKHIHSQGRQREPGPIISLSKNKRLSHLSGIKIVKKGEIPADIQANTEIYGLSILPMFTLCACYLGYANDKILGEQDAEIPIDLIWDLFSFTSGLTATERQLVDRHMMIIERAFKLFGFHVDLSVKNRHSVVIDGITEAAVRRRGKTKCIGFDQKGIDPDIFSQMLMHALRRSIV
ncbi:MAG: hypothetical protein ACD_87C00216G0003 [uncultured bacterium]|nr:MAG: hypothetical protein ACD_87C00216G0003 [uncultured bacterium]HBB16472.1 hypothetical protein [Syntrophus sp. (in: bacteria)]